MKRFVNNRIKKGLIAALAAVMLCLSLGGCASEKKTVKIASKPMTEQFILVHMLAALIENDTDIAVELTEGVGGGTANIHPALVKGEFDLYPEYTGTAWSYVLKKEGFPDSDTLFEELKKDYDAEYGLEWVGMYGFNNTFGLVVRKEIANQHVIKTYSDLAPFTDTLKFGAEYDFYEREDGYDALCQAYNYHFENQVDLDIGLKYQSINSGEIDVMNVFTTDGQLSVSDVVLLEDDRHFYQTYYCGTVVRKDTLETCPELRDVLMKMENILTDAEMAKLNYEVEGEGKEPEDVAVAFLQSKGLIS